MPIKQILVVAALTVALFLAAEIVCRIMLRTMTPQPNSLHVMWLVKPQRYFLPVRRHPGLLQINPELTRLDNGRGSFMVQKSSGTVRIFCVGGSTTRGWPFHDEASYPQFLDACLQDLLPGRRIEVINAGLMASDSFSDLSLVREISGYSPDIILLYEGRNEAYNAALRSRRNSRWLTLHVRLLRLFKTYSALVDVLLNRKFDHAEAIRSVMKQGRTEDPAEIVANLGSNIGRMGVISRASGARLLVLTQVTHPSEDGPDYIMTRINGALPEIARENGLMLIDINRELRAAGRLQELVMPGSVHPDIGGYLLMARAVCAGLAANGLIAPAAEWQWQRLRGDGDYFRLFGVTPAMTADVYRRRIVPLLESFNMPADADFYRARAQRLEDDNKADNDLIKQ